MEIKKDVHNITCPLCGFEFEEEGNKSGCSCPFVSGSCEFICCPKCHYKLPAESKSVKFIKKIFRKKE